MGWWKIENVESGQIDFDANGPGNLANQVPGRHSPDQLVNGDGPADIMGVAIKKIVEEYKEAWGRPPQREELQAVFNFDVNSMYADDGAYVGDEGEE